MGLTVSLEGERGDRIESVEDPTNILHRILPSPDDASYFFLRYVDWYGNTIFNRRQMAGLVEEIKKLTERSTNNDARELLQRITALALRGQTEPHLYLKFIGD